MKKSPNAIDVHVGSRIRFRRTMLGMSQEKLGEGLGITFQQVQKYEKGANRVGASRLQHIAEILNVPIPFFFEGSPSQMADPAFVAADSLSELMSSKECIALATAFNSIEDKRIRQSVLNLVRSLGAEPLSEVQTDRASVAAH